MPESPKSGSVQQLFWVARACPLIGGWATERVNQRAAQNNYYIEPNFGVPVLYFLNFVTCILINKYYLVEKKEMKKR